MRVEEDGNRNRLDILFALNVFICNKDGSNSVRTYQAPHSLCTFLSLSAIFLDTFSTFDRT